MTWHPEIPLEFRNEIVTGDARELAARLPDASVDLIFTDPVYDRIEDYRWLAETAARVLKPNGSVLVYFAMYHLQATINSMAPPLTLRWCMAEKKIGTSTPIWHYRLFSHWKPYLWLTRPEWRTDGRWFKDFVFSKPDASRVNHKWSKNVPALLEVMASHARPGDIVLDPFAGGGSIPAVAKMLGLDWIGFEQDIHTAERARERVTLTQMPLLVPEPVQDRMWEGAA
jgi:DNA modification methylase